MSYLLNALSITSKRNVFSINVVKRTYRTKKKEHSSLIKVGVIGSGSFGDPASLLVKTCDNFANVFNCGEGTFRIMYSRSNRFRYLSNVFLTSDRWERVGGLPSLARAVHDRNLLFPTIHGPPNVENYLRKFAELTDLDPDDAMTEQTFCRKPYYFDSYLEVDYVDLHRENAPASEQTNVMAFVCRVRPRKGTVIVGKFTENNIPNDYIKTINNGLDVTLPDGRIILAKDYLSPSFYGANFLIIEIPTKEYLHNLERNDLLNEHLNEINANVGMEFVAHFSSNDIIQTPEYQQFLRRINARKHFALNETALYSGLKYAHLNQNTMNQLDAGIYPHLRSKYTKDHPLYRHMNNENNDICISDPIQIEPTITGTLYLFSVNGNMGPLEETKDDEDAVEDSSSEDDVADQDTTIEMATTRTNAFPKVIFFGTGSSFPGVTKTVTSILVHTAPDTSILLDCGEGTVGQICRFYGSQTEEIIKNIKALHITHMHGDHHMGVMDFIRMRQKYMPENRNPLLLMAPKDEFGALLNFYEENFGNVLCEFMMIDNKDLINSSLTDEQKAILKINDLKTCRVEHIENSYAICIKSNILPENMEEFKLTFSGDTIPCDALVELGKNSTLLIHEATLEDTLASSAAMKKHSTISQAIEQSEKMNAKYTILTHFSQRYRLLPPINRELMENKNIGIAFDNMEIVPDDLSKLNDIYFKLTEKYAEELVRMEARSKRYAQRSDFNSFT
ncbi:ribonuclease Z, mitochondrial-like [Contarinia nasturtii]|uniref:ribonuclease Z, mitochondrial-like n=1 Tax=Contarinia nasturtii TaxID=265458 RepID=UPI0012D4395F|nr:ribonuclease Z, mitochondrial-like [Contarinia nasturtii]